MAQTRQHTGAPEFRGEADGVAHRAAPDAHFALGGRANPALGAAARPAARARALGPRRLDGQHATALLGELRARLRVRVEHGEVAHDDGHRERDGEHAGDGARRAHEHAPVGPAPNDANACVAINTPTLRLITCSV